MLGLAALVTSSMVLPAWAESSDSNVTAPAKHSDSTPLIAQTNADGSRSPTTSQHSEALKPIEVTGEQEAPDYRVFTSNTATGTNTPLIDVPQTIQAIPEEVLRDQAAQSLQDAVRNAPGVSVNLGEGNRDEFYIRGVKTKSDFFMDGLRDDTEYFRPLYNVAHVDVLEGPAALLFGRGGAGGVINLVTKKAERRRIRNLTFETGAYQHYRGTLDVGEAIGKSGAFRLMAMGENSGGFRDHYFLHRYAVNPKFSFKLGERTKIDFDASYLNDDRFVDRGIPSRNGRPADLPRDKFFGSVNQNKASVRVMAGTFRIQHEINDNLSVRNAFRVTENKRNYFNVYPGSAVDDDGELKLKAYEHPVTRLSYLNRSELIASFDTGPLRHKFLLGAEYGWQRDNDMENLPTPDSKTLPDKVPVANPTVTDVSFPFLDRQNHVVGKELGIYAQDQVSLGKHWQALIGVRYDRFSVDANYLKPGVTPNHTHNVDHEISPRAGIIFKPVENNSIYVSVTQTFTPQGANISLSQKRPTGANLDPEQAINYEIGNKLDLFGGDLSITAALFQLNLKDVVSEAADGSGRLVNTGKQRNRGFVFSVQGALTPHWDIYANYAYLDGKITKTTKDADAGARIGLVPKNQFSIWTRYALNAHWGLGAGIRGESEKYTSFNNSVKLPGYARADAMGYYQAGNYRVQLNLNNVTNKNYYPTAKGDNEIMPAEPRSLVASLSVDF